MPFDGRNSVSGLSGNGSFPWSLLYLGAVLYQLLCLCSFPPGLRCHTFIPALGALAAAQVKPPKVVPKCLLLRTGSREICGLCFSWLAGASLQRQTPESQTGPEAQAAEGAASLPCEQQTLQTSPSPCLKVLKILHFLLEGRLFTAWHLTLPCSGLHSPK